MELKQAEEREYIFDHAWRQFKEKFYVADLQGVDWEFYYRAYRKFLPFINNNYDFAEMLSEMLGEVNASHTGCRYGPDHPNSDQTADLGVLYDLDFKGPGVKVAEVVEGGPLDKALLEDPRGRHHREDRWPSIGLDLDFSELLNRKAGKLTLLSVFDPAQDKRWEEPVKPISGGEENELLYKRWVKNRRKEVAELPEGRSATSTSEQWTTRACGRSSRKPWAGTSASRRSSSTPDSTAAGTSTSNYPIS